MPGQPEPLTAPAGPPAPSGLGVLDPAASAAALAVAAEVAARVADPARAAGLVRAAAGQTAHPATVHWRDHAAGQGHAGLALLFGALDRHQAGQGWDRTAHRHLELAARAIEALPRPPAGLFAGLAGLGLAAACLSEDGRRYRRLLAAVDRALVAEVQGLARRPLAAVDRAPDAEAHGLARRPPVAGGQLGHGGPVGAPERPGGRAVREFDLISGLAGVGAYLLLRRAEPGPAAALAEVLGRLVELTGDDAGGPRWRTPPGQLGADERPRYPHGYLNCGLAHGIPGPLAVLALAVGARVDLPGLREAVVRAGDWLATNRADDAFGPNWPNAVPLAPSPVAPARSAWCYGGPGVAAALRLAGDALGPAGAGYRGLAVDALQAALARPGSERRIDSPTFCHGQAGLLAVTATFARSTGDPGLRRAAAALTAGLVDRFDPATPLGYRDLEPGGRAVDQPALLTGAPGVALALLGAAAPTDPAWARLFLLA